MYKIYNIIKIFSKWSIENLLVLGVLIFTPLWIWFGASFVLKIPNDYSYKADIVSVDNFYDNVSGEYRGEQYSKTNFYYDAVSSAGRVVNIKGLFNVQTLDGRTIFKSEPTYGIDKFTGEHVSGAGDSNRAGYLFAPRWLKKGQPFTFWYLSCNAPLDMEYVAEENLYGLKVFKYKKKNADPIDQTDLLGFLPDVPESKGVKLASDLNMWVEPVSGHLVKLEDYSTDYFYYDINTGARLHPYNKFFNTYTENSVVTQVQLARQEKYAVVIVYLIIPLLLLLLVFLYKLFCIKCMSKASNLRTVDLLLVFAVAVGLGVTFIAYYYVVQNIDDRGYNNFSNKSLEIDNLLKKRIDIYTSILLGGRGIFNASKNVERGEWKSYIDSLNLQENYQGVQAIGYSKVVSPLEKSNFISSVRKSGFSNFNIRPSGNRKIYTPILYVEPFDRENKIAFGYDMFSDETRRKAMIQARDSGNPAVSGSVILLQDNNSDKQKGFLAYVPVYKNRTIYKEQNKRPEDVIGYIYGAFRVKDFVNGAFIQSNLDLKFHIYDGLYVNPDKMIFDFPNNVADKKDLTNVLFRKTSTIYLAGHPWTIEYFNSPLYKRSLPDRLLPFIVLFTGFLITFLLYLSIYSIIRSKKKAILYAEKMTESLKVNVSELENTKQKLLNVLSDLEVKKTKVDDLANDLKKFKLAVENASDQIVITDAEGIVIYGNRVVEKITGYTPEEAMGKKAGTLWKTPMSIEYYKHMWDVIKIQKKSFISEIQNKRKGGELYTALVSISPVLDDNGNVIYFVAIERDITKEKEVDKAKTEFVSLASHQLRTPLSSINWYTEMLLAGDAGAINKEQKKYLTEVSIGSKRMSALVSSLLNVSRLDLGTFIIDPETVNVMEMSKSVLEELKPQISDKKIILNEEYGKNIKTFKADVNLLRMVFQNLLSNAIKYTKVKGEVNLKISKLAKGEMFGEKKLLESSLTISVSDFGIGIPLSQQDGIFSKLFRADNARESETEGTGLGLYIVKTIIDQSGGSVWFKSEENKGTTFYIALPATGMKKKEGTKKID